MTHEIFLLFLDEWIVSKIILQRKYPLYSSPPTKTELFRIVECKIADFDISDAKEKHKEKFDEIQDIKSHVQEHEEVGSPHVQQSEHGKTLDKHSDGEEWPENFEYVDLIDDGNVRISRNKLCTKENSNMKKKKISAGVKEPPVADSTFQEFPGPLLTEISPYMYFKQVFDDELIKYIADQTNLYSVKCTGKSRNVDENETE